MSLLSKRMIKIKRLLVAAVGAVVLFIIMRWLNSASAPVAYVKTPGNTVEIVIDDGETSKVKRSLLVYPTEIYWGDTVYVQRVDENLSSETISDYYEENDFFWRVFVKGSASMENLSYEWVTEYSNNAFHEAAVPVRDFQPAEKRLQNANSFEFPPLEDWKNPFWEQLKKDLPSEGKRIPFSINNGAATVDILVKPRPESEMALLDKWYKNTPEKTFPIIAINHKIPQNYVLRGSWRSRIWIGWYRYDPWLFVRLGNRKPCDPNNPTTLDGWRKLEASLTPSTMRDEVRFVRLQLEIYCAKPGKESDLAKLEFGEWLQSLPTPQQTVYLHYLKNKSSDFRHNARSLSKKNFEIIDVLRNMRL